MMSNEQPRQNPYLGLRKQALEVSPTHLGLDVAADEAYGVLMEIGYPRAVMTLLSFGEGSVSLYFSSGGGTIGGGQHPKVRDAGLKFVEEASRYIGLMQATDSYPLPEVGQVRFYVLTPSGVYTYQAQEDDLGYQLSPVSPLFFSGQAVLTELRLVDEA